MDTTELRARLVRAAHYDAEYGASLSNHLPMALTALTRLGASAERLDAFMDLYLRRLHAAPPRQPWSAGEPWRGALGDPRAWPTYRTLFRDWFAYEDVATTLDQALPTLMRGAGAAAFHGLIRTAYALAANHADELADGLAYWACRWFSCGDASALVQGNEGDALAVLGELDLGTVPDMPLIAQGMAWAAAHPRFAMVMARWQVDGWSTLPRLAHLAAERYAASADFTALHLVTSAHAVRVLLPWIDADARLDALRHYALAYAAAWGTLPRDAPTLAPMPVLPWSEVVARAIESDDDHRIKLVDCCRELEGAQGGAVWATAASRAVA
ncbi:MAG: questin oxidase family protein [Aquincola sp.]|nr:questin oxidase family protein [Aquincola sp.]MDH4287892.1 questin oxidase family protein [Aquincola sp.]MDH5328329.1 questin oxidase family protein [Aquincola sp.]